MADMPSGLPATRIQPSVDSSLGPKLAMFTIEDRPAVVDPEPPQPRSTVPIPPLPGAR
jgi:hypothetical protein